MNRIRVKIVGQSGSGLLTIGEIVAKGLQRLGFHLCADREYPSLIKGGYSCYTINFSEHSIHSLSQSTDILVAIDKHSLVHCFDTLKKGGILVHGYERTSGISDILETTEKQKIKVVSLPSRRIAFAQGGTEQMANIVLLGMIWKVLGFDFEMIKQLVSQKFQKKKKILEIAIKCLQDAYNQAKEACNIALPKQKPETLLLDGNHALALGAIHAGMRFYVAYPMSPASSILSHLAKMAKKTGIIIKQAEDEITAAQMALGACFTGTRSMTATSGGGYDLMTETVSLAGILENPLVIVLAQRPGPGTGLPTWTSQGDLNMAIFSSHGEFPRIVVSISNPTDAFETIQHAFNFSEKYQVPVIILSEKVVCESKLTVASFSLKKIPIQRGLVEGKDLETLKSEDRFAITKSGFSKRWIPGSSKTYFFANGDEHGEKGQLTEDAELVKKMYAKRMRKLESIRENLPAPEIFGNKKETDISFVGWGSTQMVMKDIIDIYAKKGVHVNYLHFRYVYPLNKKYVQKFIQSNHNIHIIEGNYQGQFADQLEKVSGEKFPHRLRKWDGRPFFVEDVVSYIDTYLEK